MLAWVDQESTWWFSCVLQILWYWNKVWRRWLTQTIATWEKKVFKSKASNTFRVIYKASCYSQPVQQVCPTYYTMLSEKVSRKSSTLSGSSFSFQVQSCKKERLHITPIKHGYRNAYIPSAHRGSLAENLTSYQLYSRAVRRNMWVHPRCGKRWQESF